MNQQNLTTWMACLVSLSVFAIGVTGCSEKTSAPPVTDELNIDELADLTADTGHPEHGPHGGELVELGQEDFHVEMLHGDEGVQLYVLDGSASESVAIEAEKLILSLKYEGEVKPFELPATPQDDDETGKSSRFQSSDTTLSEWLEAGAEGAVTVQINGKSFTGKISHNHDHTGHDH